MCVRACVCARARARSCVCTQSGMYGSQAVYSTKHAPPGMGLVQATGNLKRKFRLIHTLTQRCALPCPDHIVSLKIKIVSFLFELPSETAFDLHVQSCYPAVFLPCSVHSTMDRFESEFSRPQHSRGTVLPSVNWNTATWKRTPIVAFGYYADFHGGYYQNAYQSRPDLQVAFIKLNYVCQGWREADYFGSRAWVLVKLTPRGFWQRFSKRQVLERDSTRNSRKM